MEMVSLLKLLDERWDAYAIYLDRFLDFLDNLHKYIKKLRR